MVQPRIVEPVQQLDWKGKSINSAVNSVAGSVLVRPANARRKYCIVTNRGATIKYLCKAEIAVTAVGIPLNQNDSYEINSTNPYYGALSIHCANAGEAILFNEDE